MAAMPVLCVFCVIVPLLVNCQFLLLSPAMALPVLTVIVVADGTTKVLVVGSSVCKTTGLVELLMVVAEIFSDAVEPSRNGTPISSVLTAAFINGYRSRRTRTFLGEFDLCMFDYLV